MPNLIGEIFFAVTDFFDVIQFKVVKQTDRGGGCIQLQTELISDVDNGSKQFQHEIYYKKTFANTLLENSFRVFRTYSQASNLAIQLMEQKITEIDQERQNMLNLIEKMKASQHGPKTSD